MTEPLTTHEEALRAFMLNKGFFVVNEPAELNEAAREIFRFVVDYLKNAVDIESEIVASVLNTPELEDFAMGTVLEAEHQRKRWPKDHDKNKSPADWFWTLGYLSQKAMHAHEAGDLPKLKHHLITSAALMANWHRTIKN